MYLYLVSNMDEDEVMNTSDWDHKEKKQYQKQERQKRQKSNNEDTELREPPEESGVISWILYSCRG